MSKQEEEKVPGWWVDVGRMEAKGIMERFSNMMRSLRITQNDIAKELKVDQALVSYWASGSARTPSLVDMLIVTAFVAKKANALAVKAEALHSTLESIVEDE